MPILVDTSVLLDLVLCFQQRHRRNRSIASSAAAAIETVLFYDHIVVEELSTRHEPQSSGPGRYWGFYSDQPQDAIDQFNTLLELFQPICISECDRAEMYDECVSLLANYLDLIADPSDLRAYEMYDFLPYNLGEDPTAIECQIDASSGANLDELADVVCPAMQRVVQRLCVVLRAKNHPIRAAWALPLLRLLYYQALQRREQAHLVLHLTKSTLGFGRESQVIRSKRLIDYCIPEMRDLFAEQVLSAFGRGPATLTVPDLATTLLSRCNEWSELLDSLVRLRESSSIGSFRALLSTTFESKDCTQRAILCHELKTASLAISSATGIDQQPRQILLSLPFFQRYEDNAASRPKVMIHQLFQDGSAVSHDLRTMAGSG